MNHPTQLQDMPATSTSNSPRTSVVSEIFKYLVSLLIIALGIGMLVFLRSLAKPPATQNSDALIQQVDTYAIQSYSGLLDMVVTGTVVPHREIKMAAEIGGVVAKKYEACRAGNFVNKGDKLLEIDPEEYELEIKTLEAEVVQSEKRIEENEQQIAGEERNIKLARVDLELQQREVDRNRRISNVLSQTELDQSQRALNTAQTQLTSRESNVATLKSGTVRLEAALDLSKRRLDKAKLNLRRATIVAPDNGIIVREMVQEGDYVNPGKEIVTFEDTQFAEVLCNLTPSDLAWIRENSTGESDVDDPRAVYRIPKTDVTIFDPINPEVTWRGVLERFDGIGRDEMTKTIPCRIMVRQPIVKSENGARVLVRGMYVKCRVEVQTTSDEGETLMMFPTTALHPNDHVWIVTDKKLKRINVEVVDRTETVTNGKTKKIVIVKTPDGSLKPGDSIVTSPLSQPTIGAAVILASEETTADDTVDVKKKSSESTTKTSDSNLNTTDEPAAL